jgi:NADH-quinone oxidoreductase subunit K
MTDAPLANLYLILSAVLLTIGIIGVLIRRNVLVVLMSVELMLNASNLAFVGFGRLRGQPDSSALVLFVIVLAAIEAAVGLAIFVALFRASGLTKLDEINLLRG